MRITPLFVVAVVVLAVVVVVCKQDVGNSCDYEDDDDDHDDHNDDDNAALKLRCIHVEESTLCAFVRNCLLTVTARGIHSRLGFEGLESWALLYATTNYVSICSALPI